MKNAIMLGLALGMSMLLVGCGGSAEGTAEDFLEAFNDPKSDNPLTAAKSSCRGKALRQIETYVAALKDKKETAWRNDWIGGAKDVEKCTDFSITSIEQMTEAQTSIGISFEYKVHRPKQKEEKDKTVWANGSLSVGLVDGSWKVTSFRFGGIRG